MTTVSTGIDMNKPENDGTRMEFEVADGTCTAFYNDEAHDPEDDPYLEKLGWYYQSLTYDEPPSGPYDSQEDAVRQAKDHYGSNPAPANR